MSTGAKELHATKLVTGTYHQALNLLAYNKRITQHSKGGYTLTTHHQVTQGLNVHEVQAGKHAHLK